MSVTDSFATLTLPDLLHQPREEIRALQNRLLKEQIEVCYKYHPFYSKLMKKEGLEPRHIQTSDDLIRLPATSKTDFLNDPEAFRLRGDDLPLEQRTIWKIMYTSGTTSGTPAPIYVTTFDEHAYLCAAERRTDFIDIRPTDMVANLFPLTSFPLGAYSRAPDEASACGAAIVYAHTGRPSEPFPVHRSLDQAVRTVERHKVTVLWGVASFVRRVLVRAQELGADFSHVRMAMITGEAASPALRKDMLNRLREVGAKDPKLCNRYGSTEQGASMVECTDGSGFHILAPDQVFHEVIDTATGKRLPDGEKGMIAFTHLIRRGSVFLRYMMGDVVTMTNESCPYCGRTGPRISSQPVRSGDILKVKGMLVNMQVVKDYLDQVVEVNEYQIVIRPMDAKDELSMDELVLRLNVRAGVEAETTKTVVEEIAKTIHLTPKIEYADKDAIFDPAVDAKPRRLVDLRPPR